MVLEHKRQQTHTETCKKDETKRRKVVSKENWKNLKRPKKDLDHLKFFAPISLRRRPLFWHLFKKRGIFCVFAYFTVYMVFIGVYMVFIGVYMVFIGVY